MSDIDDMRFDLYCEIEMLEKENQQLKARLEKAEKVIRLVLDNCNHSAFNLSVQYEENYFKDKKDK